MRQMGQSHFWDNPARQQHMALIPDSRSALGDAMRVAYVALSARGGTALYSTGLASRVLGVLGQNARVLYVGPAHLPDGERPKGVAFRAMKTGLTHAQVARLRRLRECAQ